MYEKSPYTDSLAHTTWECKYHVVFAPKFRRKEIYGRLKQDIGLILVHMQFLYIFSIEPKICIKIVEKNIIKVYN